jgi:hypothetical protein
MLPVHELDSAQMGWTVRAGFNIRGSRNNPHLQGFNAAGLWFMNTTMVPPTRHFAASPVLLSDGAVGNRQLN